ncbi:MAG: 50S ribosomal protein L18 [Candidatus Yanofskybacteria bacterium GW2011_GWC2_37_9]|uniref:50S ribosomal protein L18 n=1 Tax=Candidatus Yanofskybacteria bacterium GW2011_GWC2_37_9 TaxID=1619028 RepID=A0A0G0L266_9BACT|nr:MAG: 50S ribosomal protein L18 [Candidatus Yanofskybacteria bacterium GW2011_GWC2_37_9]
MQNKTDKRIKLKKKIRAKIKGTAERPRLTVFRSNKFIYAQVINDATGKTLAQASDVKITKGKKTERAKEVGRIIGQVCLKEKISKVVFDRNARATGLKF